MFLRTLVLWLHVGSVICWFGGLVFYLLVAAPAARAAAAAHERLRAVRDLDQRFRHVVWGSVEVAVVTGIALLMVTMFRAGSDMRVSPAYMRVLAVKLGLAALIIGMQLYDHIKVRPRKAVLAEETPAGATREPDEFLLLQTRTRQIYALELLVAAALVFLGVHMRAVL